MEMFWHWNLPRAGQLIDRGVALEPSDPEAHAIRGTWFRWRGEMDSAVAEARKSVELDPLGRRWPDALPGNSSSPDGTPRPRLSTAE